MCPFFLQAQCVAIFLLPVGGGSLRSIPPSASSALAADPCSPFLSFIRGPFGPVVYQYLASLLPESSLPSTGADVFTFSRDEKALFSDSMDSSCVRVCVEGVILFQRGGNEEKKNLSGALVLC